jgi:hypothetical protein
MINFTYVINEAGRIFELRASAIKGRSRRAALVRARWAVFYATRELGASEIGIAYTFQRTHSTVQHGILSAKALMEKDSRYLVLVNDLLRNARREAENARSFIVEEAAQQLAVEAVQDLIALNQKDRAAFRKLIAETIAGRAQ